MLQTERKLTTVMDHKKRLLGLEKTLSKLSGYEGWMIALKNREKTVPQEGYCILNSQIMKNMHIKCRFKKVMQDWLKFLLQDEAGEKRTV